MNSLANFDAEAGSVGSVGRFDAQMLLIISQLDNYSLVLGQLVTYVYKILHPRTFSLLFIPKIIVLPVVVYSIAKFRSFINEKKWALVYLACMLWAYLGLFIVRASHGRYTFPLVPIFIIFMLLFLIDGMQNRKFFARVFIATVIYISLGQLLEVAYVSNVALLLMLFVTYRLASNNSKWKNWSYAGFIILLGGATLAGPTAFMILRGQIDNALNYGIDYEIKDILAYADPDETIWINNIGWSNLPRFVRDDVYLDASFKWDLAEWIPKHATEETWGTQTTYSFSWGSNIEYFEDYANKLGFDKVFIIESTLPGVDFGYENQLAPLQTQDWLVLEETVPLKNKILYVFDVATAPTSP